MTYLTSKHDRYERFLLQVFYHLNHSRYIKKNVSLKLLNQLMMCITNTPFMKTTQLSLQVYQFIFDWSSLQWKDAKMKILTFEIATVWNMSHFRNLKQNGKSRRNIILISTLNTLQYFAKKKTSADSRPLGIFPSNTQKYHFSLP